jgi:hypothetical protein
VTEKNEERSGMTQVELSEDERNERSRRQSAEQVSLDNLYAKKESHNREWNEQIKQHEKLISQLAQEAETGKAWVPAQTDMFGGGGAENDGDEPSEEAAASDDEDPTPRRRKRGRRGNGATAGAAA